MIMSVGTFEVTSVKIVTQEAVTFQCKGGHGFAGDVKITLIVQRAHAQHPIYPEDSEVSMTWRILRHLSHILPCLGIYDLDDFIWHYIHVT